MMKKRVVSCILVLLISVTAVFAVSMRTQSQEDHPFDSWPMIERYYNEMSDSSMDFWEGCTVSLLTVSPGAPLYSWFGHSAFLVTTPDGREITFDYGTFSFRDEDFFTNFAMGRLWFVCHSSYADYHYEDLDSDGRTVSRVILPLNASQKKAVIGLLNANIKSENREYLYHHYTDNCATRLRDIIDRTTDGDFQAWAKSQSGLTFRQQASRELSLHPFVQWALEFLQSGRIDKQATLWDEMFQPDVLERAVKEYFGLSSEIVVDNGEHEMKQKADANILFAVAFGLMLGILPCIFFILRKRGAGFFFTGLVDIILGILGSLLLFMMVFTDHDVTWMNENIIFVNPLLLVAGICAFIGRDGARRFCILIHRLLAFLMVILVVLKLVLPSVFIQQNWNILITVILFYLPVCILPRLERD